MSMNFPDNPSINDEFTNDVGRTWVWTGSTWKSKTVNIQLQIDTAIAGEVVNRNLAIADAIDTANEYTNGAIAPLASDINTISSSVNSLSDEILLHSGSSTNVHGISDTADLVYTADLASKQDVVFGVSDTEIGYLSGVTSDIQNQLDGKASAIHGHTISDVTGLQLDLDGKADLVHTHVIADVTNLSTELDGKSDVGHTHIISDTTGLQLELDGKADTVHSHVVGDVTGLQSALDSKADTLHAHTISDVTGLQTELNDKADVIHSHAISDVTNLQTELDGKAALVHTHIISDTTGLQSVLDAKANLAAPTFTGTLEAANVTITGNLVVQGTTTTISTSDLSVKDNMIYLNQAGISVITNAVGNGTNVTYTTQDPHGYIAGNFVTVSNVTPSSFNVDSGGVEILSVTANTFTIASTVTDTYASGGTSRGKTHANPDLGWAAGRYDTVNGSGYGHTGIFRDATDGVYKFFDGYLPEPDESAFIDITDPTFELAPIQVSDVTTVGLTATGTVDLSSATVSGVSLDDLSDVTQTSATSGDVLYFDGSGWVNKYVNEIPAKTNNATVTSNNYNLVASDAGKIVEVSNSVATTVTIPSSESYPVGTQIVILQTGAGQITVTVQSPAVQTLNYSPGNKLRGQWAAATLLKRGTNSWVLYGDLAS